MGTHEGTRNLTSPLSRNLGSDQKEEEQRAKKSSRNIHSDQADKQGLRGSPGQRGRGTQGSGATVQPKPKALGLSVSDEGGWHSRKRGDDTGGSSGGKEQICMGGVRQGPPGRAWAAMG